MKKLIKRLNPRRKIETDEQPSRITNETVAEHREQILAGGRKFKYPIQYQRHKLVINSIVIGLVTIVLLGLVGWQQLYQAQNTSKFIYRVTQLIPVPVASVQGQMVRYGDYLMKYRSSIHYLEQQNSINLNTSDGERQSNFIKRQELDSVERDAYATKLAAARHITVSSKEVNDFIQRNLDAKAVSLDAYEKTVLSSFYDWSLTEYQAVVHGQLLKRKVGFAVDAEAKTKVAAIQARIAKGDDFATVASENSEDQATKTNGGDVGSLPIDSQDSNGLIKVAKDLAPDQVSDPIMGNDGYYILKLVSKDANTVHFLVIKVGLTAFEQQFKALRDSGQIKEYISVPRTQN